MRGYEPKLKDIYFKDQKWCCSNKRKPPFNSYSYIKSQPNLQLDGLISHGGSSSPVHYQMWFTDHHPDICSTGPTECWLEHAVLRFSHDIANDSALYTGISGRFLREYSRHAVGDYIVDKANHALGLDYHVQISPILNTILGISKTNEEGALPFGKLTFIEPRFLDQVDFFARFQGDDQPLLDNYKHVRKLLQAVEHSELTLISNGTTILGIANYSFPHFCITADFQGKLGFVTVDDELICSFQDGSYISSTHKAKLFEVEEALLDFDIDPSERNDLFHAIASLVHNAEDKMFGCTFVLDLAKKHTPTAGQQLTPPINLKEPDRLELAGALSKVDGALHIRADLHLHSFACLLDGHRVENENRARGARYNSALRFTAQHQQTIVIVVSADRPVSVFRQGREIQNRYTNSDLSQCNLFPLLLRDWIEQGV